MFCSSKQLQIMLQNNSLQTIIVFMGYFNTFLNYGYSVIFFWCNHGISELITYNGVFSTYFNAFWGVYLSWSGIKIICSPLVLSTRSSQLQQGAQTIGEEKYGRMAIGRLFSLIWLSLDLSIGTILVIFRIVRQLGIEYST